VYLAWEEGMSMPATTIPISHQNARNFGLNMRLFLGFAQNIGHGWFSQRLKRNDLS
jgi:hypothetical protein